jgi:hypothetical protein
MKMTELTVCQRRYAKMHGEMRKSKDESYHQPGKKRKSEKS